MALAVLGLRRMVKDRGRAAMEDLNGYHQKGKGLLSHQPLVGNIYFWKSRFPP